jgi:hypothetical protein
MNILVEKQTNLIKHQGYIYIQEDSDIVVKDDGGNIKFYFGDLNRSNCDIYEIDNPIEFFIGNKYLYIEGEIVLNPEYIEPEEA